MISGNPYSWHVCENKKFERRKGVPQPLQNTRDSTSSAASRGETARNYCYRGLLIRLQVRIVSLDVLRFWGRAMNGNRTLVAMATVKLSIF